MMKCDVPSLAVSPDGLGGGDEVVALLVEELAEEDALRDGDEAEVEDPVEDREEPEVAGVVGESPVGILDHDVPSEGVKSRFSPSQSQLA